MSGHILLPVYARIQIYTYICLYVLQAYWKVKVNRLVH